MKRYQVSAYDAAGRLLHTGPKDFTRQPSLATIRRGIREWEHWADGIREQHGDCPTAESRRKTVLVIAQSITPQGQNPPQNAVLFFDIPPADSLELPLPAEEILSAEIAACPDCNAVPSGPVPPYCAKHDGDYSSWLAFNNID